MFPRNVRESLLFFYTFEVLTLKQTAHIHTTYFSTQSQRLFSTLYTNNVIVFAAVVGVVLHCILLNCSLILRLSVRRLFVLFWTLDLKLDRK